MHANHSSLKSQAMQCLRSGESARARDIAESVCKSNAADIEAWTILAAAYANLGVMPQVALACRKIIKLQPDNITGHYNLGVASQAMGKHDAAEKSYRKVLALKSGHSSAMTNLASVLLAKGYPDKALELLERQLAEDSQNDQVFNGIALVYKALGKYELAIDQLKRALECAPDHPDTHFNLGAVYLSMKSYPDAEKHFTNAINLKKDHIDANFELGRLLIELNRYADAANRLERTVELKPDFSAGHFHLAHVYYLLEKYPQAVEEYNAVLKQEPSNVAALNNLGRVFERTGKFGDAISLYRKAQKLRKEDPVIYCNIGRVLRGQKKWSSAAKQYQEAITVAPTHYDAYLGLGQALCELGEIDAAKAAFDKSIDIKPDLEIAKYLRATLDGGDGDTDSVSNYVANLFDNYAEKFDHDLVDNLKYRIPDLMFSKIRNILGANAGKLDIMDLGCGTGLCGPLFKGIASSLDGVDLSLRMIDKAKERNVYDALYVDDVVDCLMKIDKQYDLLIAADVFVYIGNLAPVIIAAKNVMRFNALFAFSVEFNPGEGYKLQSSGRLSHSKSYVRSLLEDNGLAIVECIDCDVRLELGIPVKGMVFVARKSVND